MKSILRFGSKESERRPSLRSKRKNKVLKKDGYTMIHLGHAHLSNPQSLGEILSTVIRVKKNPSSHVPIQLVCRGMELQALDKDCSILSASLLDIGQCVQNTSKDGFSDCIAVSITSGQCRHQCHIFQAKDTKEASEIVQSINKCITSSIKNQRRKTDVSIHDVTDGGGRSTPSAEDMSRLHTRRRSEGGMHIAKGEESPLPTLRSISSTSLGHILTTSPGPKVWRRRREGKDKEHSRADKINRVHMAWEEIDRSNITLRVTCSNPHPQSPFEHSLHAINSSSDTLLSHMYLLSQHQSGVDAYDHQSNNLMHYAVAMQKTDAIRVLHEKQCSVEHPNVSMIRPLHRAVVGGGDKLVLVSLLERRANVNAEDCYKNTPLHYAACHKDQHEACWILLQYGAMVNKPNAMGIRPIDLLPDLNEMQNRLIISVCKTFVDPPEKTASPLQSPSLPSSTFNEEYGLGENILEQFGNKQKSIRPKGRKHRMRKHNLHRSISLSELAEAEEDEMYRQDRQKKLQFPYEHNYDQEFLKMEQSAGEVQDRLNKLVVQGMAAKRSELKRSSSDPELTNHDRDDEHHYEQSQQEMSEKFINVLRMFQKEISPPRGLEQPPKLSKKSNIRGPSPTSELIASFDTLQLDLEMATASDTPELRSKDGIIKISPHLPSKSFLQKAVSSPVQENKKGNHKLDVLDDYVSLMLTEAGELDNILKKKQQKEDASTTTLSESKPVTNKQESTSKDTPVNSRHPNTSQIHINIVDSDSSSEFKRRHSFQESRRRGHHRTSSHGGTSFSATPSSSLSSLLHSPSHHGSLTGLPFDVDSSEPGAKSLHILGLLSRNPECAQNIISHICLSDFKEKLISTASSLQSSDSLLYWIASLVTNLFECGGHDGRTTAIESGMMDIIVKLLSTRDPIPGTCLNLLNSLIVSGDDGDYLKAIVRIPCEPLLVFLEPCDSDADSGLGRDASLSSATTSDHQMSSNADDSSGKGLALSKDRGYSLTSESSSSAATPTLQGTLITRAEARRIVLKLLAQSSNHVKVKNDLSQLRTIALLMDYLSDPSQENILNATISLANIAQNVKSHALFFEIGVVDRLRELISNAARIRFHALRTLVYLGKIQLSGMSLFDCLGHEYESVILATDSLGHEYARGISLERTVSFLATSTRMLWGGLTLSGSSLGHRISREKIIDFVLMTYRSFMHPVVFMRLLLHRLDVPDFAHSPFNWSQDLNSLHQAHINEIIPIHQSILHVIGHWMEAYPEDFRNNAQLKDAVTDILHRLKKFRGVYTPHVHKLQSLLKELNKPNRKKADSLTQASDKALRVPHHENLYMQCKQLISEDLLPVTMETALYLGGLQLHIETLADSTLNHAFMEGGVKGKKESRVFLTHLKHALPAWCFRGKNIGKRIREKLSDFEGISERTAKHKYIEKCLSTPGYNSTFYSVKVPSGGKFRRGTTAQLFGIGDTKLLFLDEKTRDVMSSYDLKEVISVRHSPQDVCTILIKLSDGYSIQLQVEKESIARQIQIVMDNLEQKVLDDIEKEDIDDFMTNWGHSPSSLQMSAGQGGDSHSSPSSPDPYMSKELEDTIIPVTREEDTMIHTPTTIRANGTPLAPITPVEMPIHQAEELFTFPVGAQPTDDHPIFCDCPPDPEIPLKIDIRLLSLQEILRHPIEVARQVTLIEHDRLCAITREELMQRSGLVPKPKPDPSASPSCNPEDGGIKRVADTFNQLSKWVIHSILQYTQEEDRGWVIQQFVVTAHHCLMYRNFSSTWAIVAGLNSQPIRRLDRTWEHVSKSFKDQLTYLKDLFNYRNNFKHYRELVDKTQIPAVPYLGIFCKDLAFIADGNPDYLKNTINLHKRRQLFAKIEEIRHFQRDRYNFEPVIPLQMIITNHVPLQEDDFHSLSHSLEPPSHSPRPSSHSYLDGGSGRHRSASISSLTTLGFIKHSFNIAKSSGSSSNLLSV